MTSARAVIDAAMTEGNRDMRKFLVRGIPAPKGNIQAFLSPHTGKVVTRERPSGGVREWQTAINFVLQSEWLGPPLVGPVSVTLDFTLPKPKSARRGERYSFKRPDLDKLVRAALDAMTGVAFRDDAQVAWLSAAKRYDDGGESLGVVMLVWPLPDGRLAP